MTTRAAMMLAVEFGFRHCERGANLEATLKLAETILGPSPEPEGPSVWASTGGRWGFTWPITASDTKPVTSFKNGCAKAVLHMAQQEADRRTSYRATKIMAASVAREDAYRAVAGMLENIIIEGE